MRSLVRMNDLRQGVGRAHGDVLPGGAAQGGFTRALAPGASTSAAAIAAQQACTAFRNSLRA